MDSIEFVQESVIPFDKVTVCAAGRIGKIRKGIAEFVWKEMQRGLISQFLEELYGIDNKNYKAVLPEIGDWTS